MRRRTFLTATAIGTTVIALPLLTTYTRSKGPVPTPSFAPMQAPSRTPMPDPPNAAAVPSSFSSASLWPDLGTPSSITALREHYLCGDIVLDRADEARRTVPDGHCPVVVDLKGPTTWAVLPDDDGAWTTRTVQAAGPPATPITADPSGASTVALFRMETGPALLDEKHAYLTVGLVTGDEGQSSTGLTPCSVDLVKVDLADGSVAASARLSSAFIAERIKGNLSLSFTEDRSALLVSGSSPTYDLSLKGIGLRLSAADLSVQLDAATVLTDSSSQWQSCGEALTATYEDDEVIVYLADGTTESLAEMKAVAVRDGWLYYYDATRYPGSATIKSSGAARARRLNTGETVTVSETGKGTFASLDDHEQTDDRLSTDQHEVILWGGTDRSTFSVRRPGEAEPLLSWEAAERAVPDAACVFGDVLYTFGSESLQLISLTSGNSLSEVPGTAWNWGGSVAVTAWGLAVSGVFYPATEWFSS